MVDWNTGVGYIRAGRSTRSQDGVGVRICAQRVCAYCELHLIALDATLIDKGMVTQDQTEGRKLSPRRTLGMLRVGGRRC